MPDAFVRNARRKDEMALDMENQPSFPSGKE
jgi:hypothetical protein